MMNDQAVEGQWIDMGAADLADGELRFVETDAGPVLLVGRPAGVTAFQGKCSHVPRNLEDATIEDGRVVCSRHLSAFDPDTGDVLRDPAVSGLVQYEVAERDGRLALHCPPGGLVAN